MTSEKIPSGVPGFYAVMRHGGRSSDEWRAAYTFGNLPMAEARFELVKKNMRQGGLSLIDPGGIELRHYEAPLLRTRW
jgi:hypothetical protein